MKSITYGVRTAAAAPGLILVLWCWSLVLGLAATALVAPWWYSTLSWLPEADGTSDGVPWRVLADLVAYDRTPVALILLGAMIGLALVAIVGNSFLVGGAIAVLIGARQRLDAKAAAKNEPPPAEAEPPPETPMNAQSVVVEASPTAASAETVPPSAPPPSAPRPIVVPLLEDDSPLMHRFGRGAGRFFVRNLRLLLLHILAAGAIVVAATVLGLVVTSPWRDAVQPVPAILSLAIPAVIVLLGLAFFSIVLDYARIRLVAGDGGLMISVWLGAMRFVVRRFGGALGVWASFTTVIVLATLLFVAYREFVPVSTWTQIAMLVVAQQAFMIVRSGLRIALLSAEIDYYTHRGRW